MAVIGAIHFCRSSCVAVCPIAAVHVSRFQMGEQTMRQSNNYAPRERTTAEEVFAGEEEINVFAPLLFAVIGIVLTIGLIEDGAPIDHMALYGAIGCFAVAFLVRYLSPAATQKRQMRRAKKATPLRYQILYWAGLSLCAVGLGMTAWEPISVFFLFPLVLLINMGVD